MSNEFTFGHENGWNESNLTIGTYMPSIKTSCITGITVREKNIIEKLTDREHLYRFDEKIEDAKDEKLIDEYIYLIKEAKNIQTEYEMYLISHKEDIKKYKKLLGGSKDLLKDSYTKCHHEFLLETEVFDAIQEELYGRGYEEYCDILWDRYYIDCDSE